VAVSKTQPPEKLQAAVREGCLLFGENYVQELLTKVEAVPGVEWHFIGHLQTNKVKQVLPHVALIHSVDRSSLIQEIGRRVQSLGRVQPILLEVNLAEEPRKSGVTPAQLYDLAREALETPGIALRGLMTLPPPVEEPEQARPWFRQLRALRDEIALKSGVDLSELSMGMSADFEVAIEEGATLVRVGTAIFGART